MSINAETRFYLSKGIMTLEESKKLNDDREFLDCSLLIGNTTEDQLYKHILVEIDIFHRCLTIIKKKKQNDNHTKLLLLMLFGRINKMFAHMFYLFPINNESALKYVKFLLKYLSLIFPRKYRRYRKLNLNSDKQFFNYLRHWLNKH